MVDERHPAEDDLLERQRRLAGRPAPAGEALPPVRTLEELEMTLGDRVAEWPKKWLQEGIEQGVKQGIEQGLAHERALLSRQAALRFGDDTASRVSEAVGRIADLADLAVAGEWIVRAETGDELVARLTQFAEGRDAA